MPDQITSAGLEVKSYEEIVSDIIAGLQAIYGFDINVAQNSPDGQLINIFAQAASDLREVLVQVYNSFGIETAFGKLLDQRLALNGIARKEGTYTFTDIAITIDRALNLVGLDAEINNPDGIGFTVADAEGNQFILAASQTIVAPGIFTYSFRAKEIGAIETTPNTIVNPVTIVLGVTAINNPDPVTTQGDNEETDLELRIRHAQSFLLAATGPADSVLASILALDNVTDAYVAENVTNGTVDTVPAHAIWVIAEGGAEADIGLAIYSKKAPGCGMKGAITVEVPRPNGMTFPALFDRPLDEDLWIEFTIVPRNAGVIFDTDVLKQALFEALHYRIAQQATAGDIVVAMLTIAPDGILTDIGVSDDDVTYEQILQTTDVQHKFVLDVARIDITV